jgi:hypothetical protein
VSLDIGKLITIFFIGMIIVLVVTHAPGFAQAGGTLFSGVEGMGNLLSGASVGNSVYSSGGKVVKG